MAPNPHYVNMLIYCSSMATYGKVNTPPFDESMPCTPVDPYGLAKLQAEQQLKLFQYSPYFPFSKDLSVYNDQGLTPFYQESIDNAAIMGNVITRADFATKNKLTKAI